MDTQTKHTTIITMRDLQGVMTEVQTQKLINLKEAVSDVQWQAGDLINDIYAQACAHELPCTISQVCYVVANELQSDYSPATLRIYAAVARFYPAPVRANYPDVIPFWAYRYAARFEDQYAKVLTWILEFQDRRGRLPYLREVSHEFEPAGGLLAQLQPPPPPAAFPSGNTAEGAWIETHPNEFTPVLPAPGDDDMVALEVEMRNLFYHLQHNVDRIAEDKRPYAYQLMQIISALLEG